VSLQHWDLPLTINDLPLTMWVKKLHRKTLAQGDFDRRWSLHKVKRLVKNISVRSLTLLFFAVGWALCGVTTTQTQVSDATAGTFSIRYMFKPIKILSSIGNIFRKWFASYFLFNHEHLIIMLCPTVNLIAVTTLLLTSSLHRC